jgi:hypothetical protein
VLPAQQNLDEHVFGLVLAATGVDFTDIGDGHDDDVTLRRFRQPKRMFGGGIRSQEDVALAAWIGGLHISLPHMLDSVDESGATKPGFMNELAPVLGAGSFDAGKEETRFAALIASGTHLANQFLDGWNALRGEVTPAGQDAPASDILSVAAASAGYLPGEGIVAKPQKAITKQREEFRQVGLQADFDVLPATDERRIAFMNVDRLSSAFVGSVPHPEDYLCNTDFKQVWQDYFGLPGSQFVPFVGMDLGRGYVLDAFGHKLTTMVMSGDGWRRRHDTVKWLISSWAARLGISCVTEVYGLFAAYVAQRDRLEGEPMWKRQGMVPDFMLQFTAGLRMLAELKMYHQGVRFVNNASISKRCSGVASRAAKVGREYKNKARKGDRDYNDFQGPGKGPMEARLEEFGPVLPLVFGPRGEGSKGVHFLIKNFAELGAERSWRGMGARSQIEGRACITASLRRSLGIAASRSAARLKSDRLGIALGDGKAAAKRRAYSSFRARSMWEEYYSHFSPFEN